jgi:hypothetical protein
MTELLQLVVVAKDAADMRAFNRAHVPDWVDLVEVVNTERQSLSSIGNYYLRVGRAPVFGIVHADCHFGPDALKVFYEEAMEGRVCGIVGLCLNLVYHWCRDLPGRVSTLDSCSVFFRRDLQLKFDEQTFDSFHLHVEDVCLQAEARNISVTVPYAEASHKGATQNGAAWLEEYHRYRSKFGEKWADRKFATT